MPATITLQRLRHPTHTLMSLEWEKFRLAFEGGIHFKQKYLKKFSTREGDTDFNLRRDCSYVPAHAKAAILDIRNAIFKSMVDITRVDGPASYNEAVVGLKKGVDGKGNSMNSFLGQVILPELLVLGRVGIYVDKPAVSTGEVSLAEAREVRPYLYHYQAEDIFSWHFNEDNELDVVLLRDHEFTTDEATGLIDGEVERFRLLKLVDTDGRKQVEVTFYGEVERGTGVTQVAGGSINPPPKGFEPIEDPVILDIPEIPFVLLELDTSLMTDVADVQIALLNLASSDINYALKSNFPFFTEQFHPSAELPHLKQAEVGGDGTASQAATANSRQAKTGVTQGRRYPIGTERPGFINPSAEPLRVSMELQEKLKREIRQLVNLSLANLSPMRASAESKDRDNQGLEGGLQNIGLELEFGERNLGRIWWWYESDQGGEVTVKYPDSYSLLTDVDRRKEAKELNEILPTIPSKTFQRETAKDIVRIMQGHKVSKDTLEKMHGEIDKSPVIVTDPDIIKQDHESGFVGTEMASRLRGYPEGEVDKAKKDHAERAAAIVTAQMGARDRMQARGAPDLDTENDSGSQEREEANDTTMQTTTEDRTRGEGQ